MTCGRCKASMYEVKYGYGSNLERTESKALINGYSCPICGNWVEREIPPFMALAQSMVSPPKPKMTPTEFIMSNFKHICALRRQDLTWAEIKDRLNVNCSTHLVRNVTKKMLIAEVLP